MNPKIYQRMAKVEDAHWWFRGRRALICQQLERMQLKPDAAILDAGSGTGGNLFMLSQFGRVYAMELDDGARSLANARGITTVAAGKLPDAIPFGDQRFDLAVLFDVLEHVEEDGQTLAALHARLAEGGRLLLTVPAFSFLWSNHDVLHHHKRRYHLPELIRLVEGAGYKVTFASYINFWLFPLIALRRLFDRAPAASPETEENMELRFPPAPVNSLLEQVFCSERLLLKFFKRLPFGVSIILSAVAT